MGIQSAYDRYNIFVNQIIQHTLIKTMATVFNQNYAFLQFIYCLISLTFLCQILTPSLSHVNIIWDQLPFCHQSDVARSLKRGTVIVNHYANNLVRQVEDIEISRKNAHPQLKKMQELTIWFFSTENVRQIKFEWQIITCPSSRHIILLCQERLLFSLFVQQHAEYDLLQKCYHVVSTKALQKRKKSTLHH